MKAFEEICQTFLQKQHNLLITFYKIKFIHQSFPNCFRESFIYLFFIFLPSKLWGINKINKKAAAIVDSYSWEPRTSRAAFVELCSSSHVTVCNCTTLVNLHPITLCKRSASVSPCVKVSLIQVVVKSLRVGLPAAELWLSAETQYVLK